MKKAPASFQKQTLILRIHFLLHQPDQQLVDILRGFASGQQLVPEGQHRACQQPMFSACKRQDDLLSPEHHTSPIQTKR